MRPSAGRRHPEPVVLALHDEHRDRDGVELRQAARRGRLALAGGRLEREREADHPGRSGLRGCPAGDPGARGAPADHDGQAAEAASAQVRDHGDPGGVELSRGRGGASAGDAVRLLDQHGRQVELVRGLRGGHEIARPDAATGTVSQDQGTASVTDTTHVDARRSVGRRDLDRSPRRGHGDRFPERVPRLQPPSPRPVDRRRSRSSYDRGSKALPTTNRDERREHGREARSRRDPRR